MDALFGLSMNTIMFVLLGMLGVAVAVSLLIFIRDRIIFMIGLRNIPRRVAQTVLIVIGLMLSTVIITAAFTTGDTVDYSITKQVYDLLGHSDVVLDGQIGGIKPDEGESPPTSAEDDEGGHTVSAQQYQQFLAAADSANLPDVDGYTGIIFAPVPAINNATGLSEPDVIFTGVDEARMDAFPDIIDDASGDVLDVRDLGPGEVYMNSEAADELGTKAGDQVDIYVNLEKQTLTVKAIVESNALTGAHSIGNKKGIVASLATVQGMLGTDRLDNILVSATGGVRNDLATITNADNEVQAMLAENDILLEISDTKVEAVDTAEETGNIFTTFFLLMGLFSIGAGMLLIVMTFVMLAAERKSEMGMARAVGAKRRHLIEMFLAEGTGYDMMAAFVGVLVGVLVAYGLAIAASALFSAFGLTFTPHATLRTLIISYCIGVVLTFLTVMFSSWRISNLNIVRAIRDTPEPPGKRMGWRGITMWVIGILLSVFFVYSGLATNTAFTFMLGVTIITMGAAVFGTFFGLPPRPTYTTMATFLLIVWGFAAGGRLNSITGELNGDFEMFFESGIAMVTASTFILIYNADILLKFLERIGDAFGSLLPALRTAIAYPMANRFRTGMTLAMISLVVFALTMMSAMNLNYDKLFLADDSRGGWDVQVVENPNNPIRSIKQALTDDGSPVGDTIVREGSVEIAGDGSATEVIQGDKIDDYPVRGLTAGILDAGSIPLDKIANGYETQQDVWAALGTEDDVAVVDGFTIQGGGFGDETLTVDSIPNDINETKYDAPTITVRDAVSGKTRDVRVIGVISFGASNNFFGVFMGAASFEETFGPPVTSIHFLALDDASDSDDVAKEIESTLVVAGVQADSLEKIAEENNALSRNFLYLMQAFMGLGLVVGIAAVGVIAFRTVVERRQQIGMLRAIGYKRSTVALSFLLESSFVTVLGTLAGMSLGIWLAYFLVSGDDFPAKGQAFHVPWLQMIFLGVLTLVASLAMTWIPARQAASVPTAEALRYE